MQDQPVLRKSHHRVLRSFHIPTPIKQKHKQNIYDSNLDDNNPQLTNPSNRQQTFGKDNNHLEQIHYQNPQLLEDSNVYSQGQVPNYQQNFTNETQSKQEYYPQTQPQRKQHKNQPIKNIFEMIDNNSLTSVLPQLKTPKKNNFQIRSDFGQIKRQNVQKSRYTEIKPQTHQSDETNILSPQKTFNKLALSLMGVKRIKNNKSCLEKRNSMMEFQSLKKNMVNRSGAFSSRAQYPKILSHNKKKYQNRIRKDSQKVQIYQHAVFPFRADDINYLKKQIQGTVKEKWQLRASSYDFYHKNKNQYKDNKKRKVNEEIPTQEQFHEHQIIGYSEIQPPNGRIIKIDHKSSLAYLKQLLSVDEKILRKSLHIQIPQFFTNPPTQFSKISKPHHPNSIDINTLQNQACYIFSCLQIPINNLYVKKYSNCLVVVNSNYCLIWHTYNMQKLSNKPPKRYLGNWKNRYFDEGVKQGMGMQWAPGRYIYYGQFQNNKRHGFGVMKAKQDKVIVGYWKSGKAIQYGIQKNIIYD